MKKTIYWVSVGFKLLAVTLTLFVSSLAVVFSIFNPLWYALLFLYAVALLCLSLSIISFIERIKIDLNCRKIILHTPKRNIIDIKDLSAIEIDTAYSVDSKKFCFVNFKLKNGKMVKIHNYSTLLLKRAVLYTQKKAGIIADLTEVNINYTVSEQPLYIDRGE